MTDRLPSCTARDVDKALTRGGFTLVHQKGSHRYYASPTSGNYRSADAPWRPQTAYAQKIIKDAGLSEDEFRALL